jgi:broad specificity phosphatase PhoE
MQKNNRAEQRTIWLVRHGLRQDFVQKDWGQTAARPYDSPLAKQGRLQAKETGLFLKDKNVEVIYSSPFLRAVETAAGISDIIGAPIRIEHGLAEVFKKEWFENPPAFIPVDELKQRFPAVDASYRSRVSPDWPEDDQNGQLDGRCALTVKALLSDKWTTALWVGHGASVGSVGVNLIGHARDVCFRMCGLTGWISGPDGWSVIYSGVNHLSITEDEIKFHV